jgi:phage terminase large subunit-like protein
MRHEKGRLQGQRFRLEDWQVFILCNIFGFIDEDGTRKYREAFILVPRGNGKSPLAAIIAIWMTFFDGEPGAESYCGAASEEQAHEVFRPAKAMLEQVPELTKRYGITVAAKSIYQSSTRSRFKSVIREPKDGASIYLAVLDEWHQALDAVQYDCFRTGANKRKNSLLLEISTAGVSTQSPCLEKQKEVEEILDGTVENDRLFGIIYTVDPETDWTTYEALVMANPNLGISNDEEALLLDQAEAVRNSAKHNIFRCKHLNQWMTATTAWMNTTNWQAAAVTEFLTEEFLKSCECFIGLDLASTTDIAAAVKVFRKLQDGKYHYYIVPRFYLPEARTSDPTAQHYQRWVHDGYLVSTDGAEIDYQRISADLAKDVEQYNVKALCYDPWGATDITQQFESRTGIMRVKVPMQVKFLSEPMKRLESGVLNGTMHHDNNPCMNWQMSNVEIKTDFNDNIFPRKNKPEDKIDGPVATIIALSQAIAPAAPERKYTRITFF